MGVESCYPSICALQGLKEQLPKPDAEGKRPASALDGKIAELEQVGAALCWARRPHCT